MYTMSLKGWAQRLAPARRQGRRSSFARPSLEALEERYALAAASHAVVAPTTIPAFQTSGSAALLALQSPFIPQPAATAAATPGTPGARYSLNPLAPLAVPASISLQGQGQNAIPSFAIPTGFPGRLLIPDSGVTTRVATGYGPMTAPAGLFLPGGGGDQTQTPEIPPASRRIPAPVVPLPGRIDIEVPVDADTDVTPDEADVP
jgi:hypothetical protein